MKLALGAAQFGLQYGIANQSGQVSREEGEAILRLAHDRGIASLDTAIAYGDSEQRLGEIGIHDWQVTSKLPELPVGCRDIGEWVTDCAEGSLRRLRIDCLYGLLLHRPQQLLAEGGDHLYRAVKSLKDAGLVQKIGVSIYDPSELAPLISRFDLDLIQAPFNVMDRRLRESGWLSRLAERGTEVHVRSVFLQGLLLMKPGERPRKFERWAPLLRAYDAWIEQTGVSPLQACMRDALSVSEVSTAIIGVDSVHQLEEVLLASVGPAVAVPAQLQCNDVDLLNPARWAAL